MHLTNDETQNIYLFSQCGKVFALLFRLVYYNLYYECIENGGFLNPPPLYECIKDKKLYHLSLYYKLEIYDEDI